MTPDNINFIDPTSFKLLLERTPHLEYFCKSVSIPAFSVAETQASYRQTNIPMLADKINFEPLTLQIAVDEDMKGYLEIFDWINECTLHSDNISEVMSDIGVVITTSHNNKSKTVRFSNAFPISIGSLEFNSTETANTYLTAEVTFRFSNMTFE